MKKKNQIKNAVYSREVDYQEEVNDFTGLIFHCPSCNEVFHLHIANVRLIQKK